MLTLGGRSDLFWGLGEVSLLPSGRFTLSCACGFVFVFFFFRDQIPAASGKCVCFYRVTLRAQRFVLLFFMAKLHSRVL